jgi:hypothetical protein
VVHKLLSLNWKLYRAYTFPAVPHYCLIFCEALPCIRLMFVEDLVLNKLQDHIQGVPGMCQISGGCSLCKLYRYNPKHECPKLNGYGDNGQRKVWSSCGSTHCTSQLTLLSVWPWLRQAVAVSFISSLSLLPAVHSPMLTECVTCSAWNSKDSYEPAFEFFVVQFNGVTLLTS